MRASLGKNILKLLSGKIATQVVSLITAPILARIYLPEHFGVIQLLMSISSIVVVISCLRYEFSIPLGKNNSEALSSLIISLVSTSAFSLIILILVPILKARVALWLKSPELESLLWLLPITVLMGGYGHAVNYYATRSSRFGAIAWANFFGTFGNIFVSIPLGLIFGASSKNLFAGYFAGNCLIFFVILIFLSRQFVSDFKTAEINLQLIWKVAKYHKKFPLIDIWTGLFNSASTQMPPIILGAYFSTTIVGYYSLGNRFVGLPILLLGQSISQVFFPSAAKEYNETGKLVNIVSYMSKRLIQMGVFPFMVLGFFGGPLFGFVFGENWTEAGIYSQILSIYVLFQFISSPLSSVFPIFNRQGTGLILTLTQLFSRILALIIFARLGVARNCLLAYSGISLITYILIFYFVYHFSKTPISSGIKFFIKYIIFSLILLLPTLFLVKIINNVYFIIVALIIDTILYLFILYRTDLDIRNLTHNVFKKLAKTK